MSLSPLSARHSLRLPSSTLHDGAGDGHLRAGLGDGVGDGGRLSAGAGGHGIGIGSRGPGAADGDGGDGRGSVAGRLLLLPALLAGPSVCRLLLLLL